MNSKKQSGFTLIELSIYITLVAGILIMATSFAWNIINSRTKTISISSVEQEGRYILEKFSQSVHQASAMSLPATGASGNQLVLTMADAPSNPIIISTSSNKLYFQRGAGSAVQMHSDNVIVTSVSFTNLSTADGKTRNVQINLTLEHINPNQRREREYQKDFTTSAELRDY